MLDPRDTWQAELLPRLARHHFPHSPWRLVNEGEAEEKRRKEALPCAEAPYRGRCPGARSVVVRGRHGSGFRGGWVGGEGKCRHCTQQWKAVCRTQKKNGKMSARGVREGSQLYINTAIMQNGLLLIALIKFAKKKFCKIKKKYMGRIHT